MAKLSPKWTHLMPQNFPLPTIELLLIILLKGCRGKERMLKPNEKENI